MTNSSARSRRDGVRSALMLALATVSSFALNAPAWAQSAPAPADATEVDYDIPAQPLSSALLRFAEQSGLQVLFAQNDVEGLSSRPLRGRFTPEAALAELLPSGAPRIEIAGDQIVRVGPARPQYAGDEGDTGSEEIVVTGTRIRGAAPAGANVLGLDRADIEESGRGTLQDVLQTLPQVSLGSQSELTQLNSTAPGRNLSLGSSVDLRGLGADATLTLLDGRRLAPAGLGNFVDISAIPLAAIERVEILADGASATYGADAVGGVVNIILRRDLDGAETTARFGGGDGFDEVAFSHTLGATWSGGSLIAGYEYRDRTSLSAAERDYAASSDLRPFGGTDFSRTNANPGNIIRVGATPVTYAIPAGQDGTTLTMADLLPGQVNRQNNNEGNFLLPAQESHSAFLTLRQQLSPRIELFFDALASTRDAHAERPQLATTIQVPETNYYRQQAGLFTGQGPLFIGYFFGDDFGPLQIDTSSRTWTTAAGANIELFSDWSLEAVVSYGAHGDENDTANTVDVAALAPALASSNVATAFNPFGDGSNTPDAVLRGVTSSQFVDTDSELVTYALKADGGLIRLPAGLARMAIGVEHRREAFSAQQIRISGLGVVTTPRVQDPGRRTTDAYFAELLVPLLDERAPLTDSLTLSLSIRREESSDFGEATTPKIGLDWRLAPDLRLRGTWGTSFRAPQFTQMLTGTAGQIGSVPVSIDPNATNGSTGLLQILGSNRSLEPEEAESWTAGFDFTPQWLEGLRFSATYFDIDFANRISSPGSLLDAFRTPANYAGYFIANPTPQQIADYLALADTVIGAVPPDGIEVIWDERLTNLASLRVRGVDLSASYAFDTGFGQATVFANASRLLEFSRSANPALPSVEVLNTIFNPIDWRGRAGVSLANEHWSGAFALNYANSYRDTLSTPNRDIDAWITYDARLAYRLSGDDRGGTELALDVRNLTDEDPPFANNPLGVGFDTLNASPMGRVIMAQVTHRW
jgi:outer membrane receptor protein involved in Fe transport